MPPPDFGIGSIVDEDTVIIAVCKEWTVNLFYKQLQSHQNSVAKFNQISESDKKNEEENQTQKTFRPQDIEKIKSDKPKEETKSEDKAEPTKPKEDENGISE